MSCNNCANQSEGIMSSAGVPAEQSMASFSTASAQQNERVAVWMMLPRCPHCSKWVSPRSGICNYARCNQQGEQVAEVSGGWPPTGVRWVSGRTMANERRQEQEDIRDVMVNLDLLPSHHNVAESETSSDSETLFQTAEENARMLSERLHNDLGIALPGSLYHAGSRQIEGGREDNWTRDDVQLYSKMWEQMSEHILGDATFYANPGGLTSEQIHSGSVAGLIRSITPHTNEHGFLDDDLDWEHPAHTAVARLSSVDNFESINGIWMDSVHQKNGRLYRESTIIEEVDPEDLDFELDYDEIYYSFTTWSSEITNGQCDGSYCPPPCRHAQVNAINATPEQQTFLNGRLPVPGVSIDHHTSPSSREEQYQQWRASQTTGVTEPVSEPSVNRPHSEATFKTTGFESIVQQAQERVGHSYKIENVLNDPDMTFGIEIECKHESNPEFKRELLHALQDEELTTFQSLGRWRRNRRMGYRSWSVETDSSVGRTGGYGCELVSPVLTDTPQNWQDIKQITEIIDNLGGFADNDCGMHVHIGSKSLGDDPEAYHRLAKIFNENQDGIYRLSTTGDEHRGVDYAIPFDSSELTESPTSMSIVQNNFFRQQFSETRRRGLNMANAGGTSRNTVELRVGDGTVDPHHIQRNVVMAATLVQAARNGYEPSPEEDRSADGMRELDNILSLIPDEDMQIEFTKAWLETDWQEPTYRDEENRP